MNRMPTLPPFVVDMHCHAFNATDLPVYGFIVGFLQGYRFKSKIVDRFIPRLAIHLLRHPIVGLAKRVQLGVKTAEQELDDLGLTSLSDVEGMPSPHLKSMFATTQPIAVLEGALAPSLETPALFKEAALRVRSTQWLKGSPGFGFQSLSVAGDAANGASDEDVVVEHFAEQLQSDDELRTWFCLEVQQAEVDDISTVPAALRGFAPVKSLSRDLVDGFLANIVDAIGFLKSRVKGLFDTLESVFNSVVKFFDGLRRTREENLNEMASLSKEVDLFVHSLIDMNLIAPDNDTSSSAHASQVLVHEHLFVRAAKRRQQQAQLEPPHKSASFHGFVGFSPEVDGSLDVAKEAVEHRGFLGVKLYLNTGFWPVGNEGKLKRGLGATYDVRLLELYEWCCASGVPILAHTGEFNAFSKKFRDCSWPNYWRPVLKRFDALRLCFGHFGLHDPPKGVVGRAWYLEAADVARDFAGQCFFDISNTDELTDDELGRLRGVLAADTQEGQANRKRLMYGSDYYMCELNPEPSGGYLERALKSSTALAGNDDEFVANYFGVNALAFLGLRPEDRAREREAGNHFRLERWYRKHGLERPSWLPSPLP